MSVRTPTAPLQIPAALRREVAEEWGDTAWASPPPAPSWKVYAICLLLGDVGLLLIALDVGLIRWP